MFARWALITGCATLTLAVMAMPAQAGTPGNSLNAKACQKGGWQQLVGSTGQGFTSEKDCTSYAAKGGTLSPKPVASLTFEFGSCSRISDDRLSCPASLIGYGLMPDAWLTVCPSTGFCFDQDQVRSDGTVHFEFASSGCLEDVTYTIKTTTADGTAIETSDTCSL